MSDLESALQEFEAELQTASSGERVQALRVKYLGRKGKVTLANKSVNLGALSPDERRAFGTRFNSVRRQIEEALEGAEHRLRSAAGTAVEDLGFDATLPAPLTHVGALHPITATQIEIEDIFRGMGFQVVQGDEAVSEYENFDALNIPGDHPARDMQDTFWLENGMVLRTHTSSMQNAAMRKYGAPLRAIFPGRCYRNEATDTTHENTFYQLEGMMIDRNISVAHLIGVMKELIDRVFRVDSRVRLRPGFFPFVEPGFELDYWATVGSRQRWMELMPCGMIHRKVLEHGGIDPDAYSGFAFGLGLTRFAMIKFSVPDARLLNSGDLRFSSQFTASL
jgi:phenylalanyl-tRNA synthetase alpha chain